MGLSELGDFSTSWAMNLSVLLLILNSFALVDFGKLISVTSFLHCGLNATGFGCAFQVLFVPVWYCLPDRGPLWGVYGPPRLSINRNVRSCVG